MSISFDEDLYVVDSDHLTCYSPIDMSVSVTSTPASVIDFNNDPPSPDPSTLSDINGTIRFYLLSYLLTSFSDLITLDSFIPILENLSGFYLNQNSYVSPT